MDNSLSKISWKAPEYEFHEKSPQWFWALGIIVLALILAAVILSNFLFAVLAVLSGFTIAVYGARKPHITSFSMDGRGIHAGNKLYDYESLKHFWVHYEPPHRKELLLELKKTFSPRVAIMISDIDPEKLRNYLLQYLKEKKIEEPMIVTLSRWLRI